MTNPFFERNTISNWIEVRPQNEGLSKMRSKRSQSVSTLKLDPSKFQHREVFDSKIYQKVNFFRCGLKELKDYDKSQKTKAQESLQSTFHRFSGLLNEPSLSSFPKNYSNLWGLVPESTQKDDVIKQMTQYLITFFTKLTEKVGSLIRAKTEIQQNFMRSQVDLKLSRKDFSKMVETQPRVGEKREEKEKSKKLKQKIMALDYELKKETLKSETLQQQIIELNKQITELKKQNKDMVKEKEEQSHYKQSMEFKVKRLKEELEVAHIVKQQNLADKMKYIMNW